MIPPVPMVQVPLAATLLLAGVLLVRLAGSGGADAIPAETAERDGPDLGRLPFSPFAEGAAVARADGDRPDGRTLVLSWVLGALMMVGGAALAVGAVL